MIQRNQPRYAGTARPVRDPLGRDDAGRTLRACARCGVAFAPLSKNGEAVEPAREEVCPSCLDSDPLWVFNTYGYDPRPKCPYGHIRQGANLLPSDLEKRGVMTCLLCNRARARSRRRGISMEEAIDQQALRDEAVAGAALDYYGSV